MLPASSPDSLSSCVLYMGVGVGDAVSLPSIHAPGLTSSFFAYVENALVLVWAALKHPIRAEHKENILIIL